MTGAEVRQAALALVQAAPGGLTVAEINAQLLATHPEMVDGNGRANGTIRGATWDLHAKVAGVVKTDDKRLLWNPDGAPVPSVAKPEKPDGEKPKRAPRPREAVVIDRANREEIQRLRDEAESLRATVEAKTADIARLGAELTKAREDNASTHAAWQKDAERFREYLDHRAESVNRDGDRLRAAMAKTKHNSSTLAPLLGFSHRAAVADVLRIRGPRPLQGTLLKWVEKVEKSHGKA